MNLVTLQLTVKSQERINKGILTELATDGNSDVQQNDHHIRTNGDQSKVLYCHRTNINNL